MTSGEGFLRRILWYLICGLAIGVGLGLWISWILTPAEFVDTTPASLRNDFKDQYRVLIASSYQATGDLQRARIRLASMGDADPALILSNQSGRAIAAGDPTGSAFTLAFLAKALQALPPTIAVSPTLFAITSTTIPPTGSTAVTVTFTPSISPSQTGTPIHSPTPRPTRTPTATIRAPFLLSSQKTVCDVGLSRALLQIEVQDAKGQPVPGAEIIISWTVGNEHIFTGLKPELGDGYADFVMTPGEFYTVQMASGSTSVTNLEAPSCQSGGGAPYWGNLLIVFQSH